MLLLRASAAQEFSHVFLESLAMTMGKTCAANHPERSLLKLEEKATPYGSDDLRVSESRKVRIFFGDFLRSETSGQIQGGLALAALALAPLSLAPLDTITRPDVNLSTVTVAPITAASLWRSGTVIGGAHVACITPKREFRLDIHTIGPVDKMPSKNGLRINGPKSFDLFRRQA
jgi:hypothetical protein